MVYCVDCEIEMNNIKSDYKMSNHRIIVRDLPAYQCPRCGSIFFDVDTITEAKKLVEKQFNNTKIQKFKRRFSYDGKNLTVRIPKQIEKALKLDINKSFNIWLKDEKHIILEL